MVVICDHIFIIFYDKDMNDLPIFSQKMIYKYFLNYLNDNTLINTFQLLILVVKFSIKIVFIRYQ